MLFAVGIALQMSIPSPFIKKREYEVYLRGPSALPVLRYGTVDAYWLNAQYLGRLVEIPEPEDAFTTDYGVQESGSVTVQIVDGNSFS